MCSSRVRQCGGLLPLNVGAGVYRHMKLKLYQAKVAFAIQHWSGNLRRKCFQAWIRNHQQ